LIPVLQSERTHRCGNARWILRAYEFGQFLQSQR